MTQWQWWSGSNDEYFTNGPFETSEEAIEALDGEGGWIIEAQSPTITFSAERLIEDLYFERDDYFSGEYGEADRVGGEDTIKSADDELQQLLDAWLDKWKHTFITPETFLCSRNRESIPEQPESPE